MIRALADASARWARQRAARDAAAVGHRDEQLQVNQIETHRLHRGSSAFVTAEGSLRNLQIVPIAPIGQCGRMFEPFLLLIAAAFLLAGFIKGVIGLGLPTVSMGLLAVTMPPSHALAIVIVPAIITNIWQTFGGPYLRDILRRLWPLMLGTVVGIWLNAGMMTGPYARYGTIVLGVLLVIYAILGLSRLNFSVAPAHEKWIGGIVGVITGMVSAATGVQVIPSMPFMQAIGMEKEELVQALGVFFTVATVALAFNLTSAGLLNASTALPGAVAMAAILRRHVHRPGGALADAAGSVPPLVPDRDDPARDLSHRQRAQVSAAEAARTRPRCLHPPSSPAKAGDPVFADVSDRIEAAAYWIPAFASMTVITVHHSGARLTRTMACRARRRRTRPRIARGSGPVPAGFHVSSRR